jgi:hypothetical protein
MSPEKLQKIQFKPELSDFLQKDVMTPDRQAKLLR